jgi:hypothetical protein
MAEVVALPCITKLDLPAERILNQALERGLQECVVIGFDAEGGEFFASSVADGGAVLWHLERAKLKLLRLADELS